MAPNLESARIKNYKSLGDINLSFKNLTIIVGANSSGKSCSLESLHLLKIIVEAGKLPPSFLLENEIRKGEESAGITFQVSIKENNKNVDYSINLTVKDNLEDNSVILSEELRVAGIKVISINNGEGNIQDERTNPNRIKQPYRATPYTVALSSIGNIGEKPITKSVSNFIQEWKFYDLDPDFIRSYASPQRRNESASENPTSLDLSGQHLQGLLQHWASVDEKIFQYVSDEIRRCLNINLIAVSEKNSLVVKVKEANGLEIPFRNLSDGTLRMIGYFSLLYEPHIPTLIAIEEPERNFHPGILQDIASILKRLSQKTQVVITTHSSQLLDCFSIEDIRSSDVSIILFKKNPKSGTEAIGLDSLSENCSGLQDWMQDFGVGDAIYHSHLLQEFLES
jgi:predicted ATPase